MVDAHCHLNDDRFAQDEVDKIIESSKLVGVDTFICNGSSIESSQMAISLAKKHRGVFATVGLGYEQARNKISNDMSQLKHMTTDYRVVAVGECGLDYWENMSLDLKQIQQLLYSEHIKLAKECDLPLVVHCRNAFDDIFKLTDYDRVQLHCFTGSLEHMQECIRRKWFVSFGGILTFKKSAELREIAKQTPETSLLVETDSPYLAPEPRRSERNIPGNVKIVARLLADIRNASINQIEKATTDNARRLFINI